MAWICFDWDETLVQDQMDEMGQPVPGASMPTEGAVESLNQLAGEGHRLTVHTSRFAPMPDVARQRLKEQLEQEAQGLGFPPLEFWTGTSKPMADAFIGKKDITYDNDWGLVLAQLQYMMHENGLMPQQPQDPSMGGEEQPQ